MTINEIFAKLNEKFFRQQERQVIEEVSKLKNCVISTGGGAVLDPANIKNLRAHGILICLSATPEEIHRRTKGKTHRPLLNLPNVYERIVDLMTYREPFYAVADYIIDTTDLSIKEVVDEVIDFLRRRGGKLEN
jgi:shikimate kinase